MTARLFIPFSFLGKIGFVLGAQTISSW